MKTRWETFILIWLVITLAVVWAGGVAQIAKASSIISPEKLASDEVIDNDVFATGQQIAMNGTIHGDAIVIANQVEVNGTVDGSLLVIGQQVVIQGEVSGTTYVAGVSLDLGSQAVLQRSLYFIGLSLTTQPDSAIQRDLNTICLGADINGNIGRNTRATIGILEVAERIINGLGGSFIAPGFKIRPGGQLPLGFSGSLVTLMFSHFYQDTAPAGSIDTVKLTEWLIDRLREFGLLLLLGAVFYWVFRAPLNRTAEALRLRPLPALGYGLLALLITTNIFLVGLLVASLIFVIGFWLGSLGLWDFAVAFWALSFAALAFFLAALWFLVAYGTKLVVAFLAGRWFFEKITPRASIPAFFSLVFGVLVYVLLHSIPLLGWVLAVLVTAWGLGGFWLAYRRSTQQKSEEQAAALE